MKRYSLCVMLSTLLCSGLSALDTQQFYRSGFVHAVPRQVPNQPTASLEVRLGSGSAHRSFGPHERKTGLFNAHGPFDVVRLGQNLQDLTSKPVTARYWGAAGRPFDDLSTLQPGDGLVEVSGNFHTTTVDIALKQTLFSGFYAEALVPCSELKVHGVSLKNIGSGTVKGVPMNTTFLNTDLPAILAENGLKGLSGVTRDMGVADPILSLGWEGFAKRVAAEVSEAGGYLQVGVSLPAASGKDHHQIFDVPRGYNGHVGFLGRGAAEACLWGVITVGVQAGVHNFLHLNRDVRLKTDKAQNGWILLEQARVKEDLGSLWDVGGYLSLNNAIKGVRALVGYHFTRQEETRYQVRDANYLKTYIAQQALNNVFISKDDFANSDTRLNAWEAHVMQLALRFDSSELVQTAWSVQAAIEYNYPLFGRNAWVTPMVGGTLGASLSFNF
ncbi:hypothetical protein EBZ39_13650 [bacterium]|nr:hypothetical protein [bacterium]